MIQKNPAIIADNHVYFLELIVQRLLYDHSCNNKCFWIQTHQESLTIKTLWVNPLCMWLLGKKIPYRPEKLCKIAFCQKI